MGPIRGYMTEANIIDGKAIAEKFRSQIADNVRQLKNIHNLTPGLAVVLVGSDPASEVYVNNKQKMFYSNVSTSQSMLIKHLYL